jgi:hypothetical protein
LSSDLIQLVDSKSPPQPSSSTATVMAQRTGNNNAHKEHLIATLPEYGDRCGVCPADKASLAAAGRYLLAQARRRTFTNSTAARLAEAVG